MENRWYNLDNAGILYAATTNRKNFEVSHILSDGRGSINFFKLLISNYLKIKYKKRRKAKNIYL